MALPDPWLQPFSGLDLLTEVGLGGRSQIYDRARRNELPIDVFRVGQTYRVRTIDVWNLAGLPLPARPGETVRFDPANPTNNQELRHSALEG